jgi:hypothetical protein
LFREAFGVPGYKLKFEPVVNRPSRGDRILRHDATIPFYFHLEIVPWQDRPAEIEDVSKAFRLKTVIEILGDVSLQNACFVITESAAAIDELLRDVSYFGEVKVRRNLFAARQNETREGRGMRSEEGFEFM